MDAGRPLADWRSDASYAALAACGRHAFAWEWLRRSAAYARAAETDVSRSGDAAAFGLHKFELVDRDLVRARPIWRADVDPYVLTGSASPSAHRGVGFDFAGLDAYASFVLGPDRVEHWLWSDGAHQIRLDVVQGSLRDGPIQLGVHIMDFSTALPKAITLQRLVALARRGGFVRALFPSERRALRWARILRTHDAIMAGASRRDIAEQFFGIRHHRRWRVEVPSYYQRVRRLVLAAQDAASADPRRWLDGSFP